MRLSDCDVSSDKSRVILQPAGANFFVSRRDRFVERVERNFRIDDDRAITRQTHDQVGTNATLFRCDCFLFDEVAVLQHARELDDAAQLNLAPTTANVRHAQRFDEVSRFRLELQVRLRERLHLLAQLRIRADAVLFELADLAVDFFKRLFQRLDQVADRVLASLELAFRVLLKRFEVLFREIEKRLVVVAQRVG